MPVNNYKVFFTISFVYQVDIKKKVSKSFNDLDTCNEVSLMVLDRYQDEFTFISVGCNEVTK